MLPPKVAILIATAYSLGTTPRTGMTRLMAKICKTHLSRSQLQRQRQPTTIPFVLNVQENRGHIGVCPRASSLSMPEKSHCEDRLYYRDIFEFRYIGPRIEMQSDPSQTRHSGQGLDDRRTMGTRDGVDNSEAQERLVEAATRRCTCWCLPWCLLRSLGVGFSSYHSLVAT
ncbi:hypothetical protein KCU92_g184, partial [Aureobasidium melanogenum]